MTYKTAILRYETTRNGCERITVQSYLSLQSTEFSLGY